MKWQRFPDNTFQTILGAGKATVQPATGFSRRNTWLAHVEWKGQSRLQTGFVSQQAAQEWAEAMLRQFHAQDTGK